MGGTRNRGKTSGFVPIAAYTDKGSGMFQRLKAAGYRVRERISHRKLYGRKIKTTTLLIDKKGYEKLKRLNPRGR